MVRILREITVETTDVNLEKYIYDSIKYGPLELNKHIICSYKDLRYTVTIKYYDFMNKSVFLIFSELKSNKR